MDRDRPALRRPRRSALVVVPLLFVGLFFVWPLVAIGHRAAAEGLPIDILTRTSTLETLWFTTWQATASTALTLVVGLPAAWALSRFSFRGRTLLSALLVVPFVLPTVVVGTAFVILLPDGVERSVWAILLAHVFFNVAVVVRVVGGFWSTLDRRLWESAATLGAGPAARFRHVTLPVLRPAIAAASAIVFLFCFTSFGVIVILGGPASRTLEVAVYENAVRLFDLPAAAALALLQLVAVIAILLVTGRLERRAGLALTIDAERAPRPRGRQRAEVIAALAIPVALAIVPIAVLVERAFATPTGHGLDWFERLGDRTPALLATPWRAAIHSLGFAFAATLVALVVGICTVLAASRRGRWVDGLVMLPLGASAVLLGFGFVIGFDEAPLDWRGSWWLIPIVQALVATPFVVRVLAPSLRSIDDRLRDAAAVLGASPARVRREIELPLLARAFAVAAGLAFAVCLGEFGATLFVARADLPTLPVAIVRFLGRPGAENAGQAAALSVVLMVLTVLAVVTAERVAVRRR